MVISKFMSNNVEDFKIITAWGQSGPLLIFENITPTSPSNISSGKDYIIDQFSED